jgi:hypothetical protein
VNIGDLPLNCGWTFLDRVEPRFDMRQSGASLIKALVNTLEFVQNQLPKSFQIR